MFASGAHASFGNTCANFFTIERNHHFGVPLANTFSVPDDLRQSLMMHPKLRELSLKHQLGKSLVFKLKEDHVGVIDGSASGETIQTRFLKAILEVLFPQAGYETHTRLYGGNKKRVEVRVADAYDGRVGVNPSAMQMHFLKINNSTSSFLKGKRTEYRSRLGFNARPVVHIYFDTMFSIGGLSSVIHAEIVPMIRRIKEVYPDASVIFSSAHDIDKALVRQLELSGVTSLFDGMTKLSSLAYKPQSENVSQMILNDTRGMMPYIHVASDVVVIKGPINLFEGLHVGTKTLIYNNESTVRDDGFGEYDYDGYKEMEETAVGTGGAIAVERLDHIAQGLRDLQKLDSEFLPPQLVPISKTTTEQSLFLDVLASYLEQQIQTPIQ